MSVDSTKALIDAYKLPKSSVAYMAGCKPHQLSLYFRSRDLVSDAMAQRIEESVVKIVDALNRVEMVLREAHIPLSLDLRNAARLHDFCKWCEEHPEPEPTEEQQEQM